MYHHEKSAMLLKLNNEDKSYLALYMITEDDKEKGRKVRPMISPGNS